VAAHDQIPDGSRRRALRHNVTHDLFDQWLVLGILHPLKMGEEIRVK
jgi:hypothetical protein